MPQSGSSSFRLVEELYQKALDLPVANRLTFLRRECGDDQRLYSEIETLIRHYEGADSSFLDIPVHDFPSIASPATPDRIGRYRVLGLLGEGGMGVVYRAEQENPKRQVALKVLRGGVAGPEALRRFDFEAAVLARLNHPGIARIHEAGTFGEGGMQRPFFAMEMIEGLPLRLYAQRQLLTLRERVELMARICDAVQHAHQKGVIHRDLKPANILVEPGGEPKILDFGVARATDPDVRQTLAHTTAGQLIGTLAYMSPEQAEGQTVHLDTRSDVYSLGVILYELLSGQLPYELTGLNVTGVVRAIREVEPTRLDLTQRAARGDLATIVYKALEKEPDRRYPSASALAADLRRFLRHEPVVARPATTWYQLRKFAKRNTGLVGGIAAAFLALIAGVVVSVIFATGQAQALEESEQQRRIAQATNDFLNKDVLGQANPFNEPDRDIRLRDVLDRSAANIGERFHDDPLVEAAIRQTLGQTYLAIGEYESALTHLGDALELTRRQRGDLDAQTVLIGCKLGEVYRNMHRYDDAERVWREAIDRGTRGLGPRHPTTLEARNDFGLVLLARSQWPAAEALFREVLNTRREVLGDNHGATLVSMSCLGSALERLDRDAEAEALYRECEERSRRALGAEHPDSMIAISNLGLFLTRQERFAEAEPYTLEVLELRKRVLGERHPLTLSAMNNVGYFYSLQKRWPECEKYYQPTYELRRAAFGPQDPDTLLSMSNLGWLYTQQERWAEAEPLLVELLETTRRVMPDSLDLCYSAQSVGSFYFKRERFGEAEPLLREALAGFRAKLPAGNSRIASALSNLGACLRKQERFDEAEPLLLEAGEIAQRLYGPQHERTRAAAKALAELYDEWEKPAQAQQWQAAAAPPAPETREP